MSLNKKTITDDEIDLKEIILTFWKEKYLILIFTLIFSVTGYIYGTFQTKVFQTTVTIREFPDYIFEKYKSFTFIQQEQLQQQPQQQQQQQQQQTSLAANFNQEFKLNLQSLSNIIEFVEQNEELNEFKTFVNKSDNNLEGYFKGKGRIITNKENNILFNYILTFTEPLPGPQFLNDYVIFTLQITNGVF